MIISRTPLRISLIGGGSDMPAFYKDHVGGVVSMAINKYVYVMVNRKFDNKIRVSYSKTENVNNAFELEHDLIRATLIQYSRERGVEVATIADIPGMGTGLGSSSALLVGLCNIFSNYHKPVEVAESAFMLESEKCGKSVGKQDHYASAHGGMNWFVFYPDRVNIATLYSSEMLMHNLLLLWTGRSRSADGILTAQSARLTENKVVDVAKTLAKLSGDFYSEYLEGMAMERVGDYLNWSWHLKQELADGIGDKQINDWIFKGLAAGAYGGKLCGAGGGGFLLFCAPPDAHEGIIKATGLPKVDFDIDLEGSRIIYGTKA